jgi:hypothetical protein
MARSGRKRKFEATRDPHGISRREAPGIHPDTIAARLRELDRAGVRSRDLRDALDPLAGFTLGRLLLRHRASPHDPGSIDEQQYEAGQQWAALVYRHAAIMGYSIASPQSPPLLLLPRGTSCRPDPSARTVKRVRRLWSNCHRALTEVCEIHGDAVRDIIYAVCIENRGIERLKPADYGNLRVGLNALAKVFRITPSPGSAPVRAWSAEPD